MSPVVSVLIPVYNGTDYLREAIDSVLAQTFTDYELLVIDDGSTDGTWQLIQSYGERVRGFRKPNGGVASALNLGLGEMRGKWFTWLSHDDLWLPEKLEKQVAFLEANPQFKACYTDYFEIDTKGNILQEVETPWYPRVQALHKLFGSGYIHGSTMMIDRSCFEQVGLFSEQWRYTQDTNMWLRLSNRYEIGHMDERLVKQRTHANQGSANVRASNDEAQIMYGNVFSEIGVAGIFPEMSAVATTPQAVAKAYVWFGDTMALCRQRYTFADEQYKQAMYIYPSWRNLARLRWVVGAKRFFFPIRVYRKCRNLIGVAIRAAGLRR
jgi:glycosyltransferase involved in cell wall biosynthesis